MIIVPNIAHRIDSWVGGFSHPLFDPFTKFPFRIGIFSVAGDIDFLVGIASQIEKLFFRALSEIEFKVRLNLRVEGVIDHELGSL